MLIARRLVAWIIETAIALSLISAFLTFYWGSDSQHTNPDFLSQWASLFRLTLVVFALGSGYLLTTAIAAASGLRQMRLWVYPSVVGILFMVHVYFYASGWTANTKVPVMIVGAGIVFCCALFGNRCLGHSVE